MKLSWLGQAGYRVTTENGAVILIDPYLSDSLFMKKGADYRRQVPIDTDLLTQKVDMIILTHIHDDHMDFATLDRILSANGPVAILASRNVLDAMRARYARKENWMMFDPGTEITLFDAHFSSFAAMHSDVAPLGLIIEADGKTLVHTGDTMYHKGLVRDIPQAVDALLLPINGQGYNMNAVDAARLTRQLHPGKVFPMHWDMFKAFGCDVNDFCALFDGGEQEIVIPPYYADVDV